MVEKEYVVEDTLAKAISPNKKVKLAFLLSNVILVSVIVGLSVSLYNTKTELSGSQNQYTEAYQDYQDTLEDLESTTAELENSLELLEAAESVLEQITYNTDLSGSFYILSQYNRNHDSSSAKIKWGISYSTYFFNRNRLIHPSYSTISDYTEVARIIASYCRTTSLLPLSEYIRDNVDSSTDECVLNGLLNYCQDRGDFEDCMHYIEDGTDDFAKYPVETLCEGGGDCEDKSILFASMARSLGYSVKIAVTPGHCMALVKLNTSPAHSDGWHIDFDGEKYYFCETTGYGFLLGDLPSEYQEASFNTYSVA